MQQKQPSLAASAIMRLKQLNGSKECGVWPLTWCEHEYGMGIRGEALRTVPPLHRPDACCTPNGNKKYDTAIHTYRRALVTIWHWPLASGRVYHFLWNKSYTINLDVLAKNIMVLLSAQLAIISSFDPAFSLLGVEKSLLESATLKKQDLCFVFSSKVGSKEPA